MLKWVGRIFYVLFLFFLLSFLGNGSGLVQQSFYEKEVLGKTSEPLVAVQNFASMGGGYLQNNPVTGRLTGENSLSYEVSTLEDKTFNVDLLIYPLAVGLPDNNDSGIFLTIDFKDQNIKLEDYGINFISVVFYSEYEGTSIVMDENTSGNPYFSIHPSRPIISISNSQIINQEYNKEKPFDVVGIQLFAYYTDTDNKLSRYSLLDLGNVTKDSNNEKVVKDTNFLIESTSLDITNVLGKTDEELVQLGIFHANADFKPYHYWYWYTGGIYFLFIVVIPFLLFFRKPMMANLEKKKLEKASKKETEQRIENLKKEAEKKKAE